MRRRRQLSADEKALWDMVARKVTRIGPDGFERAPVSSDQEPRLETPKVEDDIPTPIPAFKVGAKADPRRPHNLLPPIGHQLAAAPVVMDHKQHRKMTRGRMDPDARLDLHGMTVAEAHRELVAFVLSAHEMGHRLLLVITGKGKDRDDGGPIPTRMGVLRHQVPQWLRLPPMGPVVMQITPAHIKHGGGGAYYVYLRRAK